jgi:dimethylglycine dehydrogenase
MYNGAICYTPDGNPIIGPAWGLNNFWLNEGHSFGITAAGGAGWQLAEWIVDGEPTIDMMGVDPRRFGSYASQGYLRTKNEEAYAQVFTTHYPDEERAAARPLKRSPCYERMRDKGAVFGVVYGWERPNWFAPPEYGLSDDVINRPATLLHRNHSLANDAGLIKEKWSFRRSNYFDFVGEECLHVHQQVGLLDMSAFAKFEVSGSGASRWLDALFANRIPHQVGRVGLCHLLTAKGGVRSEFTVHRTGPEQFYLVSAGALERHDFDYLQKLRPRDGTVDLQKITTQQGVFVLAGPRSRELLQRITRVDLSNAAFPWLVGKAADLGLAHGRVLRVNFVGELGYELHHPIEMQNYLFDLLFEAGEDLGLRPFGIRAMDALRLEKSYRLVPRELSIEYAALESGLQRFVKFDKPDFIGKAGLSRWQEEGFRWQFVTAEMHGADGVDARGSEPIYRAGELVGRSTSGGYGWRVEKSLVLGMVAPECATVGTQMEIEVLGQRYALVVIDESPFDPDNARLRS